MDAILHLVKAITYIENLEALLQECGGHIGSVSGRYYAMDRDQRWDRVQLAWDSLVHASGPKADSASAAIQQSYADDIGDEFILPTCLPELEPLQAGDELVFFQFS